MKYEIYDNSIKAIKVFKDLSFLEGFSSINLQTLSQDLYPEGINIISSFDFNIAIKDGITSINPKTGIYKISSMDLPQYSFINNQFLKYIYKIPYFGGNDISDMSFAYTNCYRTTGFPISGDKVKNMAYAYYDCRNLTGSPVCGPEVTNMAYTYYNCKNLTGAPICNSKVENMAYAYYNCKNLTGSPVCGPEVTNMAYTYYRCYDLTGDPVCDSKVTNMAYTYYECSYLTGAPICGPEVTNMAYTYYNCNTYGTPKIGEKVICASGTYAECKNLTFPDRIKIPNSVEDISRLFYCVRGKNSLSLSHSYDAYMNNIYIGTNVENMYETFTTSNIRNIIIYSSKVNNVENMLYSSEGKRDILDFDGTKINIYAINFSQTMKSLETQNFHDDWIPAEQWITYADDPSKRSFGNITIYGRTPETLPKWPS